MKSYKKTHAYFVQIQQFDLKYHKFFKCKKCKFFVRIFLLETLAKFKSTRKIYFIEFFFFFWSLLTKAIWIEEEEEGRCCLEQPSNDFPCDFYISHNNDKKLK